MPGSSSEHSGWWEYFDDGISSVPFFLLALYDVEKEKLAMVRNMQI